jgi:hypothetical protein
VSLNFSVINTIKKILNFKIMQILLDILIDIAKLSPSPSSTKLGLGLQHPATRPSGLVVK